MGICEALFIDFGNIEVSNFSHIVLNHDVRAFYVAMDDPPVVKLLKSFEHVVDPNPNLVFLNSFSEIELFFNYGCKIAPIGVFHDDVEGLGKLVVDALVVLQDVGVVD